MNEKIQIKSDFLRNREMLSQMLDKLSDEALRYVCRPILYAYQWEDENDTDALTQDDLHRFSLIDAVAEDTPETVEKLVNWRDYYYCQEMWKLVNGHE